jgi:hypothetical protein
MLVIRCELLVSVNATSPTLLLSLMLLLPIVVIAMRGIRRDHWFVGIGLSNNNIFNFRK